MAKHYTIDESKKIIYADILKLTEKEMNEVERFRRMGYSVENKTPNKAEVKRLNDLFWNFWLMTNRHLIPIRA